MMFGGAERVVVTGLGAVSCLGHGVGCLWDGLIKGRCGIRKLTRLEVSRHRIHHGGEVPALPPSDDETDASVCYAVRAGEEAIAHAGLSDQERGTSGLVMASNFGAMAANERFLASPADEMDSLGPGLFPEGPLRLTAEALQLGGAGAALSLSCASGNAAIGYAADMLRMGQVQIAVAMGYDAISELVWAGLAALHAMTSKALLPFDRRRSGTIFSEGAGALVLEALPHALARNATPLAELVGYGTSSNAFHMTHPDSAGEGMVRAMRAALCDADMAPEEIDHINAHATGTQPNDKLETVAIKTVFGEHARAIAVNGIKSMLGHAMGAASALEAVATIMTLRRGIVPPTICLEEPDPECDLDYTPLEARERVVKAALNNSAGFGGCNAFVIFRRWEGAP